MKLISSLLCFISLISVSSISFADTDFENACRTRLGQSSVNVIPKRMTPVLDYTVPYEKLTQMSKNQGRNSKTLGLTVSKSSAKSRMALKTLTSGETGKVCAKPQITVELSFSPHTVYIGKEFLPGTCEFTAIYNHEAWHVQVYDNYLVWAATQLKNKLQASYLGKVYYYNSDAEAEAGLQAELNKKLGPMVTEIMNGVEVQQKQVDSPQEYAAVAAHCGPEGFLTKLKNQ